MLEQVVKDLAATMATTNALLGQLIENGTIPQTVAEKPAPEKKTKAKKEAPKAEKPVDETPQEPIEAETEDKEPVTLHDVQSALMDYAGEHGRPAAKKLLQKFGAEKVPDITEDKFDDVIAATKIAPSEDE